MGELLRTERLVIRLRNTERTVINKLAQVERLPASTFARQLLLNEAERRGFIKSADQHAQASQQIARLNEKEDTETSLEQLPKLCSWRLTLRFIAVLSLIVSIVWLIAEPGYESLIALLGGIAAFLVSFASSDASSAGTIPRTVEETPVPAEDTEAECASIRRQWISKN